MKEKDFWNWKCFQNFLKILEIYARKLLFQKLVVKFWTNLILQSAFPAREMSTICLNVFTEHIVVLFCQESIPRICSDFWGRKKVSLTWKEMVEKPNKILEIFSKEDFTAGLACWWMIRVDVKISYSMEAVKKIKFKTLVPTG